RWRLVVAGSVIVSDDALRRRSARFNVRARRHLEGADHPRDLPRSPAHPARLAVQATVLDRLGRGDPDPPNKLMKRGHMRAIGIERPRSQPPDADLESAGDMIERSPDRPAFVGRPVPVFEPDPVKETLHLGRDL